MRKLDPKAFSNSEPEDKPEFLSMDMGLRFSWLDLPRGLSPVFVFRVACFLLHAAGRLLPGISCGGRKVRDSGYGYAAAGSGTAEGDDSAASHQVC